MRKKILKSPSNSHFYRTFPYHNTFFGYYMTIGLQTLSGIDYLALFGVVVALEIGLCKFITTCAEDFKQQYNQLADTTYKDTMATKLILKDAIEIHQRMLSYEFSFIRAHLSTFFAGRLYIKISPSVLQFQNHGPCPNHFIGFILFPNDRVCHIHCNCIDFNRQ